MIGRTNANAGNTAENLNISLKTNQNTHEDLIGTLITIKYSDIEEQYTWSGTDLLIQIPRYAKYTVTFGSVEGYKTPDSFSSTAQEKNSVSLEAIYKTELVTINVEGAEGCEISINEISIYNNEYIEVEYIESTGTQYIDTGFKHNQDTRVVMKVQPTTITANAWAFEGRNSTSDARKGVFYYYSSNDLWNTDYPGSRQSISNISDTDLLEIDYNKNVCTINGQSVTHSATTFQSSYNLTLLACNTAGTISGKLKAKLYSCQIYDNDVLIRDYVPVKNSEGVYGLYDKVNNTFSVSAVTDQFVGSEMVRKRNIAVQTSLTDTHKIPYDTEYAIEASNINGCTTPEIQMFTASQLTRSVDIVYTEAVEIVTVNVSTEDGASVDGQTVFVETGVPLEGVYIEDTSYKLWTAEEWDDSATANSIVVSDGSMARRIALTIISNRQIGGVNFPDEMEAISDSNLAIQDFSGKSNTNILKENEDRPTSGIFILDDIPFIFPDGVTKGYIPALGELYFLYQKKTEISSALAVCNGEEWEHTGDGLGETYGYDFWSSTRCHNTVNGSTEELWLWDWNTGEIEHADNYGNEAPRNARVISEYNIPHTITNSKASFSVLYDETYTVSLSDMDGYIAPESQTYTASQPTRTINMEYTIGMEEVMVHFTSTDDTGVPQGIHEYPLIVEYGGNNYEYAISGYQTTFSVPIGTTYTLIYPDVPGQITPASQTFTAEGATRRIEVQYQEMELGVFIQGVSGKLYDYETWSSQETINGIAVISEECSFVMAPFIPTFRSNFNQSGTVQGVTTTTSSTNAKLDYKGKANTEAFLNYSGISSSCVAVLCSNYTFNNGKTGYLGAVGEWAVVNANKEAVEDAYERINKTLPDLLWTSTQVSAYKMWMYYHMYNDAYFGKSDKDSASAYYIPFTTLNNSSSSEGGGGTNGSPSDANIVWSTISGTWNSSSNSSAADGVSYTCESPGSSSSTVLRCTFSGISSITFNCVYEGESHYDYLTVGAIDSSCTRSNYGTSLKGKSGTAQNITYNCTTDTHYVEFCYSKDSSVDEDPDNATVYITTYN